MSHSGAEGRRRLTVWGWLLLALLVCVGVSAFMCAGAYAGLALAADEAQARLNQPPPPGAGLAGAGQGFVNFMEWFLALGAGALAGAGIGGLVGGVALLLACRYWIAPPMRRVAGLSRPTSNG
jgi:hypothetical protein